MVPGRNVLLCNASDAGLNIKAKEIAPAHLRRGGAPFAADHDGPGGSPRGVLENAKATASVVHSTDLPVAERILAVKSTMSASCAFRLIEAIPLRIASRDEYN